MAFDMYAEDRKEKIDHHEEPMFGIIGEDHDDFPRLSEIWEAFYDGPKVSPAMSNEIVHELLKLSELVGSTEDRKWLVPVIVRLASFFSFAYRNKVEIRCVSD